MFVRRGSGLGQPCEDGSMRKGGALALFEWQPRTTGAAGFSARLMHSRGGSWLDVGAAAPDFGVAAVVCEWLSCSARAVGFQVVRCCNSAVSGATSGRRPRKVVLVGYAGRGGAVGGRGGGPRSSSSVEALSLCRVGDKVVLDVARRRDAHRNMRKVRGLQVSSPWRNNPSLLLP
jgi:hypothetical protein